MKYTVLGDLHCREVWKQIVEKEKDSDKFIFLGDYTCPKEVELKDPTDACGFLYDVLDFKDSNPDKVILLRGNHDGSSLGYHWAQCYPQDHPKVEQYWQTEDVKNWFLKNTQWIYQIPDTNIICSHAGISDKFLDNVCKYFKSKDERDFNIYDIESLIQHINDIEPCELFGFTPCKLSDYNGDSATQPCTWIRPYSLLRYGISDYIQVVGHTPIEHICNLKQACLDLKEKYDFLVLDVRKIIENYRDVWCCDNLANREYLVIEDGKFNVKNI